MVNTTINKRYSGGSGGDQPSAGAKRRYDEVLKNSTGVMPVLPFYQYFREIERATCKKLINT